MNTEDLLGKPKKKCIYFDYTGAGRGPEPIAGPFGSTEEAEAYAQEYGIDLTDRDYFIDDERED